MDVCFPSQGAACPPQGSSEALELAAKHLGVCLESDGCCNEPTAFSVLCAFAGGDDQCCYGVDVGPGWCVGRPFLVLGEARLPASAPRSDWSRGHAAEPGGLDVTTRRALAEEWTSAACGEHASVASFARFALELMAVGAPAALLHAAQRAMGDEIRHAELSFALASAYSGAPVGPGPLRVDGSLERRTLAEIAAATVREGCIGETIAALLAAEARDGATDPAVREALSVIAADEAEHAALAFQTVAWAWRSGDEGVRAAVAAAFEHPEVPASRGLPDGVDAAAWRAHGALLPDEMYEIAARVLTEVIKPAFAALRASAVPGCVASSPDDRQPPRLAH